MWNCHCGWRGAVLGAVACLLASSVEAGVPSPARQAELINLVRHDCGSCHGLTLSGGLGLPLLPEALKDKSADALTQTILHGRNGTPMPPWRAFLTDDEAGWIIESLLKGFPDAR